MKFRHGLICLTGKDRRKRRWKSILILLLLFFYRYERSECLRGERTTWGIKNGRVKPRLTSPAHIDPQYKGG